MKKKALLRNKTIVIGCGRLGVSIANKSSAAGRNVLVIDPDATSFEQLDDNFSGYTIRGDATDLSVLESAFISSAKEIIITTGNDNDNIFIAHVARKIYDVPNIYVRLDDPDKQVLLQGLRIKAIYPFELSYDKFNFMRGEEE